MLLLPYSFTLSKYCPPISFLLELNGKSIALRENDIHVKFLLGLMEKFVKESEKIGDEIEILCSKGDRKQAVPSFKDSFDFSNSHVCDE